MASRAIADWIASLPRTREFSLDWAYGVLLNDHPKRAFNKSRASAAITKSGLFDRWKDKQGAVMFRYRGPRA